MLGTPFHVGIAADHGGYDLRTYLFGMLRAFGHQVVDFGDRQIDTDDDYSDFILPLARAVACGDVVRGIAICGSGVGAAIAANRVPGARACLIQDTFSARQGVEDDDLNMLCLGGRVVGQSLAWELVQTFLAARFSGAERHLRRLAKVACLAQVGAPNITGMSSLAGTNAECGALLDVPALITAYYTDGPDPQAPAERVAFGTSGHRGSAFARSFNESHVLAITQAISQYRAQRGTTGPLFLGRDTHALSAPAHATVLEVLAANGVDVVISEGDEYTPTPVISHAILTYNRERATGLADGIVLTPSHNPPRDGGLKYNPPTGGPADTAATEWIGKRANELLEASLLGVQRTSLARALAATTTHQRDYVSAYVDALSTVVDMNIVRDARLALAVDPMGGAGVHYWDRIAEKYGLHLTVVNEAVDATFRFMSVDWDGQIRMDPSSVYAMQRLIRLKDRFDLSFACDTDHDRHGIVTKGDGLLPPNHYLCAAIDYLCQHRPNWARSAAVGKTIVSSQLIDRVAAKHGRAVFETPVGFKWFVDGLLDGSLGFAGEESAGASLLRIDGGVWTTDKDGIAMALLAAEIMARTGHDPGERYRELICELGAPEYQRVDMPATPMQRQRLAEMSPAEITITDLGGEPILQTLTHAPGNGAPIGGLKLVTESGWVAVRPSGTEAVCKIYAESFQGASHLQRLLSEAHVLLAGVMENAVPLHHAQTVPEAKDAWRNEGNPN